jgi:hypothetical protein
MGLERSGRGRCARGSFHREKPANEDARFIATLSSTLYHEVSAGVRAKSAENSRNISLPAAYYRVSVGEVCR